MQHPPAFDPSTSRIHIIAPSGPIPQDAFEQGLAVLRRYCHGTISLAENLQSQDGYFAGNDQLRLAALQSALADPSIDVILCARGGYGLTRLLGQLDPQRLRRAPKIIVGFSDITALLCWAYRCVGMVGIHGPVLTQWATLEEESCERLIEIMRGEEPAAIMAEEGMVLCGGKVEGPLIAGNLEVLRSLIGTPYIPDLRGTILALEEVGERPYRIDRALTQLLSSGALRGVRGVVVGQLKNCEDKPDQFPQVSAHDVVIERLGRLGIPVVSGFAFGHDAKVNLALPFGSYVQLDADCCTLYFLEAVSS